VYETLLDNADKYSRWTNGSQRNLAEQYRQWFLDIVTIFLQKYGVKDQRWSFIEIDFENELVFCVDKSYTENRMRPKLSRSIPASC
jgi:hypothetical protein